MVAGLAEERRSNVTRYPTGSSSSASIAADYCAVLDLSTRQLPKEGARRVDTALPDGSECNTLAHEQANVGSAAITCPPDSPKFDTAGGVALGNQELEAIRHFRDSFAPLYVTKNPDYSVFSVLLQIAKDDAILMHLVIAIGCREIDFRRQSWRKRDCRHREDDQGCGSAQRSLGLRHYSVALRAMSALVANGQASTTNIDLDTLTSILLLMIMYEQIHGDPRCRGLSTHLLGASLILERYYSNVLGDVTFLPQAGDSQHQRCALARRARPGTRTHLSLYSARLLVRISGMDVIASFYGLGGQVTGTLLKMMAEDNARRRKASPGLMDSLSWLHRYSNPLYRAVWGDVYPQTEMVDDLENRTVYDLLGACTQLRFRISQLTDVLSRDDHGAKAALIAGVEAAIQDIGHRFADLLEFRGITQSSSYSSV
ncbi:hypothetical protein SAPIO_CDS1808 [Scedosporium apiospermum]|uniref:Transcription factor domain-containing protein n=1 Tax=Pseudallescheria apiosperma TaxID=563466 RepID=A0A084GDS8_PSEDA|nr:uncharacterized protein SAPIO_CDS1808 [Scedosporium apiospermum]KEZ45490.1 hypothetical protein SAPIO_CDS1808 [Scedosporium apiospermum]